MAQFDVYRDAQGGLLLDCQSDALGHLATRMVAPLVPLDQAPELRLRLNPVFEVGGERLAMLTQYSAAIRARELGARVTSLASHRFDVIGAFDMLVTGV